MQIQRIVGSKTVQMLIRQLLSVLQYFSCALVIRSKVKLSTLLLRVELAPFKTVTFNGTLFSRKKARERQRKALAEIAELQKRFWDKNCEQGEVNYGNIFLFRIVPTFKGVRTFLRKIV